MDIFKCALQHFVGDFSQTRLWRSSRSFIWKVDITGAPRTEWVIPDHNTGESMPYYLRVVCEFFNVPQLFKGCETGPPDYARRLADVITKAALSTQLF